MSDPFAPISGTSKRVRGDRAPEWKPISPVPADAPPPPADHPYRGKPSFVWSYRDADGRLLHYVLRFDDADGGKVVIPLCFCRSMAGGAFAWRYQALDAPRPLYRLDALAAQPTAPVIVTEGEKAADAAQRLLPDYVATTSSGGCKAAAKADWSPLRGRRIVIWPDRRPRGSRIRALGRQAGPCRGRPIGCDHGGDQPWPLRAGMPPMPKPRAGTPRGLWR